MSLNDSVRRYIDAGQTMTHATCTRADEVVRDLVKTGEVERGRAQDWVEDLVRRSRETSGAFVKGVGGEVKRQCSDVGLTSLDDLARRVADIVTDLPSVARSAVATGSRHPAPPKKASVASKPVPGKASSPKKPVARKAAGAKKIGGRAPARGATSRVNGTSGS